MRLTEPNGLKIGHWYADCCAHGLYQIENENELTYARRGVEALADPEYHPGAFVGAWETKEDALSDLEAEDLGLEE
jgi:hypothetical protein